MNSINTYKYKEHKIRILRDEQGDFWFVAKDVGDALGILDISDALGQVFDDEKKRELIPTLGDPQRMIIINRLGLWAFMIHSDTPETRSFKQWIIRDVIPSLHMQNIVGKYPSGVKEDRTKLLEAIDAICTKTGIIIPEDIILKYLEGLRSDMAAVDMPTYIPFGPEWEKEMMKMRKMDIVALLKEILQNSQSPESPIFIGDIPGKECIDALIAVANAAKNFVIAYNGRNNIHSIHEIKDQHLIPLVSAIESLDRLWTIKAQESPLVQ